MYATNPTFFPNIFSIRYLLYTIILEISIIIIAVFCTNYYKNGTDTRNAIVISNSYKRPISVPILLARVIPSPMTFILFPLRLPLKTPKKSAFYKRIGKRADRNLIMVYFAHKGALLSPYFYFP